MTTEKAPEQRTEKFGLFARGMCAGFRQYTRKKTGEIVTQLLINLPGATSALQVEVPDGVDRSQFQEFQAVAVKVIPSFYEGRIIGFTLA